MGRTVRGSERWWLTCGVACLVVLCGCSRMRPATLAQLQQRAEFDTGCAAQYLRLYQLDHDTVGVVGCGWRLVYVQSCVPTENRESCTWLMNTPDAPMKQASSLAPCASPLVVSAAAPTPIAARATPQPTPDAAAGSAATGYGRLNVASDGGYCAVMVNGVSHGFTPVAGLPVPAGSTVVTCHSEDGTTIQRTVRIEAEKTSRIRFQLPKQMLVDVSTQR